MAWEANILAVEGGASPILYPDHDYEAPVLTSGLVYPSEDHAISQAARMERLANRLGRLPALLPTICL